MWGMHFTDPLYLNWFYPENSELHHGAGIALFGRDLFSPLVNFGWLGVALLAAWCIGRPYGVAPLSLTAVAIALDTGPMVPREAGTPATDMAPVALLLAAAAILINAWAARQSRPRGRRRKGVPRELRLRRLTKGGQPIRHSPTGPSGPPPAAAHGRNPHRWAGDRDCAGTKLTISGAAAVMAVGIPFIVPPGVRRKAFGVFVGGVAAVAGFWFLRNLIHAGNPLPWLREIGPIDPSGSEPGPGGARRLHRRPLHLRRAEHEPLELLLPQADREPARPALVPDPRRLRGRSAPRGLAPEVARRPARGRGHDRGRDRLPVHPAHRGGPGGAAARLRDQPPISGSRFCSRARPAAARAAAHAGAAQAAAPGRWSHRPLLHLVLLGRRRGLGRRFRLGPLGAPDRDRLRRRADRPRAARPARGGARGRGGGRHRARGRRDRLGAPGRLPRESLRAPRRVPLPARRGGPLGEAQLRPAIAVAGTSGAYNQYGFYGDDLDNHVQYVGRDLPQADFRAIDDCSLFREADPQRGRLRLPGHDAQAGSERSGDRHPFPRGRLGEGRSGG